MDYIDSLYRWYQYTLESVECSFQKLNKIFEERFDESIKYIRSVFWKNVTNVQKKIKKK